MESTHRTRKGESLKGERNDERNETQRDMLSWRVRKTKSVNHNAERRRVEWVGGCGGVVVRDGITKIACHQGPRTSSSDLV